MKKTLLKWKIKFYRVTKQRDKLDEARAAWWSRYARQSVFVGEDVTLADFNPKQHSELLDDPPGTQPEVVEIDAEDWDDPAPVKAVDDPVVIWLKEH